MTSQILTRPSPAMALGLRPKSCWGETCQQRTSDNCGRHNRVLACCDLLVQMCPTALLQSVGQPEGRKVHGAGTHATTLMLPLGPEQTQARESEPSHVSVASWLPQASTKWWLCALILPLKCPKVSENRRCLLLGALGSKMDIGAARVKLRWSVRF